jgi:serine/threonine protein kinase
MPELPPGSMFAGYQIEELAGRGGMGVVYHARDPSLERPVALKLLSAELSDNAGFRRRFEAESKIAASLDHPNVIPLFGAGEYHGLLYLAMRYVEGDDLGDEIAKHGRLEPDRAVRITAQIASALDAAHAKGLVHRDVKPANILLASGDHAYLTDFGLTKQPSVDPEATMTGNLLGTPDYITPEQIDGKEVGPRTDVYALCCVLFHALSGQPPFASAERLQKLLAHKNAPPPPLGDDIPARLNDVIARALAKEAADRFDSAGDLATAAVKALAEQQASPSGQPAVSSPSSATSAPALGRRGFRCALIAHALLSPFGLAMLGGILIAGLIFGVLGLAVPLALLIYVAAAVVTYRDQDVRQRIRERKRAKVEREPPPSSRSDRVIPIDVKKNDR